MYKLLFNQVPNLSVKDFGDPPTDIIVSHQQKPSISVAHSEDY